MKIFHGSSIIAMTAAERSAGRYMRAPDHDAGTATTIITPTPAPPPPSPAPSAVESAIEEMSNYTGEEVNNSVSQPAAPAADEGGDQGEGGKPPETAAGDEGGADAAGEGGKPPEPAKTDTAAEDLRKAQSEAAYWRGVAEGRSPKQPEAKAEGGEAPEDPLGKEPDPKEYEYGDADARYIADLAAHEARKAVRQEREEARIEERLQTVETDWKGRIAEAATVHPDYHEKVTVGADKGTWACSQIMALAIKTSQAGTEMAYHLASNPVEAAHIAQLSPLEQAKEMGRLEFRFESEAKAKADAASQDSGQSGGNQNGDGQGDGAAAKPVKKVSAAPPPPVTARGAGGRFSAAGDTEDFRAFEAHADQVLEAKAKRNR